MPKIPSDEAADHQVKTLLARARNSTAHARGALASSTLAPGPQGQGAREHSQGEMCRSWAFRGAGTQRPGRERPLQRCAGSDPRVTGNPRGRCAAGPGWAAGAGEEEPAWSPRPPRSSRGLPRGLLRPPLPHREAAVPLVARPTRRHGVAPTAAGPPLAPRPVPRPPRRRRLPSPLERAPSRRLRRCPRWGGRRARGAGTGRGEAGRRRPESPGSAGTSRARHSPPPPTSVGGRPRCRRSRSPAPLRRRGEQRRQPSPAPLSLPAGGSARRCDGAAAPGAGASPRGLRRPRRRGGRRGTPCPPRAPAHLLLPPGDAAPGRCR